MPNFKVTYGRVVILETIVNAESIDDVTDDGLPNVYDGIPEEMVPSAVRDVTDFDVLWEVEEYANPISRELIERPNDAH